MFIANAFEYCLGGFSGFGLGFWDLGGEFCGWDGGWRGLGNGNILPVQCDVSSAHGCAFLVGCRGLLLLKCLPRDHFLICASAVSGRGMVRATALGRRLLPLGGLCGWGQQRYP